MGYHGGMKCSIPLLVLLPLLVLSSACDPGPRRPRPEGACPSGLTDCGGWCSALGIDNANCGACGVACPDTHQCVAGRCAPRRDASSPPVPAPAPSDAAVAPPAGPGSVAEVLRSPCSVDSQCPTPSTCVVAFCQLPAGLCTTRTRSCDDSNPATLDVCVDKVGCENKPEPSPLKVVDSCRDLPKQIVCGADGINYYNPCSAVASAQVSYAVAPCRTANVYCSPSTATCLKGTACVDGLCKSR